MYINTTKFRENLFGFHIRNSIPWYFRYENQKYPTSFAPWGPSSGQNVVPPQSCPMRIWDQYHDQLRKYRECKRCASIGKCATMSGLCEACTQNANTGNSCEDKYGCPRSDGLMGNMPPIPPNLTGCAPCRP